MSILAILISLASLLVSLRAATFARRVKAAEIRVATLAKVSELFAAIARAHHLRSEILSLARERSDSEIANLVGGLEIEHAAMAIDQLHSKMSQVPVASSVSVYESFFHEIDHLSAISREIQARLQSARTELENRAPSPEA